MKKIFLLFLSLNAFAQGGYTWWGLQATKQSDNLEILSLIDFPFGSSSSCPPFSSEGILNEANEYTGIAVYYDTEGLWQQLACGRIDTVLIAIDSIQADLCDFQVHLNIIGPAGGLNPSDTTAKETDVIDICLLTSIEENREMEEKVYSYPGKILIEQHSWQPLGFELFNSMGSLVAQESITSLRTEISTAHLATGIYYLSLIKDEGRKTVKVWLE